jgi:ABC-type multidrug transport system fused ATPase/permease subunit
VSLFFSFLSEVLDAKLYGDCIDLRFRFLERYSNVTNDLQLPDFEDNEVKKQGFGTYNLLTNNTTGYEGILHRFIDVIKMIIVSSLIFIILIEFDVLILLSIVLGSMVMVYFNGKTSKFENSLFERRSELIRKIRYFENALIDVDTAKEVRVFNGEEDLFSRLKETSQADLMELQRIEKIAIKNWTTSNLIFGLIMVFVFFRISSLYVNNIITIGGLVVYVQSIIRLSIFTRSIITDMIFMSVESQKMETAFDYIEFSSSTTQANTDFSGEVDKIVVQNLNFKYRYTMDNVLSNINITFNKGERIAILGPNGSGKSTFVKILCGLYETNKVDFLNVDGNPIDLQTNRKISAVFQDSTLFDFKINENIGLNKVDDSRINQILNELDLSDLIGSLKYGLDSYVNKTFDESGVSFSGGEMQRLLFSRAFYNDSDVYIFDEPTSKMDPFKEKELYELIDSKLKIKTVIFVSHRMTTTVFCDRIIYLKNGVIVEEGTHDELMKLKGNYYQDYKIQTKGVVT